MSANQRLSAPTSGIRAMQESDLDAIMRIETQAYSFPWSRAIFRDCILAGYLARVLEEQGILYGYSVVSVAAQEAHLLNICVAPKSQAVGYGRTLLLAMIRLAQQFGAQQLFLEVRPSNLRAIALYQKAGFHEIGRRTGYYPTPLGREDALVMAMDLTVYQDSSISVVE